MDPEQLDFDPEEDDEMLRLKALETQVFVCRSESFITLVIQAKKLIPNYGSPPRPRSDSEDSNVPTTSRFSFMSFIFGVAQTDRGCN